MESGENRYPSCSSRLPRFPCPPCPLYFLIVGIFFIVGSSFAAEVYVINIRNSIGSGLKEYIDRGISDAEKNDADAIIFDVHTPGGAIGAARDIIDIIQNTKIPTIAYVNNEAISAGAMISLSCNQIAMVPGGTIGDAAPVTIGGQELGEKIVSYIRGKVRSIAERNGRNPDIAAAMVDKKLWLVRKENGEVVALNSDEYQKRKEDGEQMDIISPGWRSAEDEGALLTLTTKSALEYGFIDAQANTVDELLEMYQIVEIEDKHLALTSEAVLKKQSELEGQKIKKIGDLKGATVHRVNITLVEQLAIAITNPMLSSLLLTLGVLGLMVEIRTPGFGFPGFIGILCLAMLFGGHMIARIDAGYAALAFIIGLGLLVLELLVIPGFGVAGVSGISLMLGGIVFIFGKSYELMTAVFWLSASFIATVALGIGLVYMIPKTRTGQRFILNTELQKKLGYQAPSESLKNYIGREGIALTPLRPAGVAIIDGSRFDVVTEGGFIERNTPIKVIKVEGAQLLVQEVKREVEKG